jgi:prepilin peptidase CpaA
VLIVIPSPDVASIVVLSGAAAYWDVRTGRVPNALTFGAAAAGCMWSAAHGGLAGAGSSVLGWAVGLALFLPFFVLGGMGGGDVKLLAAIGAWAGPAGALQTALWAALAGGVLAVAVAISRRYLREAVRNLLAMAAVWRTVGPSPVPSMTLGGSQSPRLAYAVPIGIGAIAAILFSAR